MCVCAHGWGQRRRLYYRRVGLSLDDGLKLLKRRRPEINPIPAFLAILREYETECRTLGFIKDNNDAPSVTVGPAMIGPNKTANSNKQGVGSVLPDDVKAPSSINGSDSTSMEPSSLTKRPRIIGPTRPQDNDDETFINSERLSDSTGNTDC